MVRQILGFFLLLGIMSSVTYAASVNCKNGMEPCILPFHMSTLKSITIERSGLHNSQTGGNEVDCRAFQMTPSRVRNYLRYAGRITENNRHYTTSDSPCFAEGKLETKNGRYATWKIGILREGELHWRYGETIYLYCNVCAAPFVK